MTHVVQPYLKTVDLDRLIRQAQKRTEDDTAAMDEIIRRFEPLIERLVRSINAVEHLRDDIANAGRLGLVRAVRRHDGRPGFPALAEIYARGAMIREYKRWILPETPDTDAVELLHPRAHEDGFTAQVLDNMAPWGDGPVAALISSLSPDRRALIGLRFIDDAPIKGIAAVMGTSGPAVSQRIATIQRAVERAYLTA
jgi:RNA polymerase sigma factor (sigma-70 family)